MRRDARRRTFVPFLALVATLTAFLLPMRPAAAAFPGCNGLISFDSDQTGGGYSFKEVYVMNPDGSGVTQLTFNSTFDGIANFSADGQQIVYSNGPPQYRKGNYDLFVMNVDGTGAHDITNTPQQDYNPAWSPTGQKIVFTSHETHAQYDTFVIGADGSNPVNITAGNTARDQFPDWSPNGSNILETNDASGFRQIFVMHPDGSGMTQLTFDPRNHGYSNWSPDGTKMVYQELQPGGSWEIFTANADGTGAVRLTTDPAPDRHPAWSPDGTKIVFDSRRTGQYEIFTMDADGSNVTQLTSYGAVTAHPDWQAVAC
jgi:Tol biopolymer transport system component